MKGLKNSRPNFDMFYFIIFENLNSLRTALEKTFLRNKFQRAIGFQSAKKVNTQQRVDSEKTGN